MEASRGWRFKGGLPVIPASGHPARTKEGQVPRSSAVESRYLPERLCRREIPACARGGKAFIPVDRCGWVGGGHGEFARRGGPGLQGMGGLQGLLREVWPRLPVLCLGDKRILFGVSSLCDGILSSEQVLHPR